jgi:hypothetical protein
VHFLTLNYDSNFENKINFFQQKEMNNKKLQSHIADHFNFNAKNIETKGTQRNIINKNVSDEMNSTGM